METIIPLITLYHSPELYDCTAVVLLLALVTEPPVALHIVVLSNIQMFVSSGSECPTRFIGHV
jgi:hypothetical protein